MYVHDRCMDICPWLDCVHSMPEVVDLIGKSVSLIREVEEEFEPAQ